MPTPQLLVRLPDELVQRFKRHVAARGRSASVQQLLERALPAEDSNDDALYLAAVDVERDEKLAAEMAEWDVTLGDGLDYVRSASRKR